MSETPASTEPATIMVVAAALIAPDGRVCMHRRPAEKAHGGLWEFPGGKVEEGEGLRQALAREITEELGVIIDPAAFVPAGFADSPAPAGGRSIAILLYACTAWEGEVRCLEGGGVDWFAPSAIPALAMPPLDYPLAQSLLQLLAAGAI